MLRWLAGIVTLSLVAGCSAVEDASDGELVASDDAALTALEAEIGFDGAVAQLDEPALLAIDHEARTLEAQGGSPTDLDRLASRKALTAVLKKRSIRTASLHPLSVYDSDLFGFNDLEKALCKSAKIVCIRVGIAGFKARGASQAAYHDGNVGGRIDCFRHTYWNAAMTRAVGEKHAKAWGDAHENGYPENRATAKDRLLSDMDFFNNAIGRAIGRDHADDSDGETQDAVKRAIANGDVRAVRYDLGDRNGKLVPSSQCTDTVHCGS